MPNPEQNKLEKFEKLWNEEMEVIRTKNYPPNFNYMHDLCLRIVSQTHQQTIEEAIEALEDEYDSWPTFLPPMNKSRIMEKIMKALHNKLNAPKT